MQLLPRACYRLFRVKTSEGKTPKAGKGACGMFFCFHKPLLKVGESSVKTQMLRRTMDRLKRWQLKNSMSTEYKLLENIES